IFPLNKVKLWFGWYIGVVEVPALIVIGIWFLWQYISAFVELEMGSHLGGIAYWDHLGGFATGLLLVWWTVWSLRRQVAKQEALQAEEAEASASTSVPASEHTSSADAIFAKAATTNGAGAGSEPRPDPFESAVPSTPAQKTTR